MSPAPLPSDEDTRIAALRALEVLDTHSEAEFDALVKAASIVCNTPVALVSLVDSHRQWFKAKVGMPGVSETPRDVAFCAHAILGSTIMEVPDALADARFADNPLVLGQPEIRFYAGAPLQLSDGSRVGTLCVIDSQPRQLDAQQHAVLEQLAVAVARALETRRSEMAFHAQRDRLGVLAKRQNQQYEATPAMLYSISAEGRFLAASDLFLQKLGYSRDEVMGRMPTHFMTEASARRARDVVFPEFLKTGVSEGIPYQFIKKSGELMDVLVSAVLVRDSHGNALHSLSSVEDITQRLRAEKLLEDERSHLANIVKGTNAGIWEHDLVTGADHINDLYAQMLGYTVPELEVILAANFFNIVHPEDREHVGIRWNAHLEGLTPEYETEFRVQHKDGHWVWILSRGRVGDRDPQGKALNIYGIHLDISSRRQAIEMATRAMKDLQNTLDALPSLVAYWDKDLRYRFVNRAYGLRYGLRPDSLAGMKVSEVLGPELFAVNHPNMLQALAGHEQSFERDVKTPNGWRSSTIRYVPDWEDGVVQGIYVFIFDITEIKEAQKALASEREQLRNILEGTNAGTWQINLQTREAVINARWAEISGYALADFQNLSMDAWQDMCHPDDRGQLFEAFYAHLKGATAHYASQYRIRHREGHWIWVQDRGMVTSRTPDGKPQWVSGTHLHVHDKVMAEIRLHEQLQFVEVLLEATPTAIYLKDIEGRYLRFNKAFEQLFGIERDQWIGKTVFELVEGQDGVAMHAYDVALFQSGEAQSYEATFIHRISGQQRVGLYYKAALRDAQGNITGLVGTIMDVTERNQAARDLEAAIAKAQAATEAKGRFLANMSHELRTPMNAVLGMLKLLQTTELSPRQLDYASKTESAAKSLLGLLNDILDFSKLDAGKMELDPHPFRLDGLMRDLAVVLSSTVGNKNVEVLYDIDPALPEVVVGDSMRLRQVLINLGGNAVKFTQSGQVVVALHLLSLDASSGAAMLELSVTDSGIGIAPENLTRIFSGFSQAEASTTRRFGGTGLGLAISQRLVEMMGSQIQIESKLGQGSRFFFQLSLLVPPSIPEELRQAKLQPDRSRRVLVIDDNAISRDLIAQTSRSWGWPTETADSGEQALALIEARLGQGGFPFDVIYVDWHMPGLDGWETTARIRALVPRSGAVRPHIIMVTANGRESLSQRTNEEQGMLDGFLVKPVTASMLMDAVVSARPEHLGLRSKRRSSRRQLAGMNILVVEDNLINQQVAEELLNAEGARVSLAADGRQGVNAVMQAQTPYDVVLMDIQMPVLDGYAATREIRAMPGMDKLPIIGLTANAMESDREACLQAGMNEHMGKPFDLAQLVSLLIRLTGMKPLAAPEAAQLSTMPGAMSANPPWTEVSSLGAEGVSEVVSEATSEVRSEGAGAVEGEPDLDLALALKRMSGMASLYVRLAREFQKILDELEPSLQRLLEAQDNVGAARLLHSYKGTSGTLGLVRLAKCVTQLESRCKAGLPPDETLAQLPQLRAILDAGRQAMREALRSLGAEDSPAALSQAGPSPMSTAAAHQTPGSASQLAEASSAGSTGSAQAPLTPQAREALLALLAPLKASDLGVLMQFADLREALQDLPAASLDQLEQALQDLDLPAALQLCEALLAA